MLCRAGTGCKRFLKDTGPASDLALRDGGNPLVKESLRIFALRLKPLAQRLVIVVGVADGRAIRRPCDDLARKASWRSWRQGEIPRT